VPSLLAILVFAILALRFGWVVFCILLGVFVLCWVVFPDGRIELDGDGITLLPLVPVRPRQRIPFNSLGSFDLKKPSRFGRGYYYLTVRAPITEPGRNYLVGGFIPRHSLEIQAIFALKGSSKSLGADELVALLEEYRTRGPETVTTEQEPQTQTRRRTEGLTYRKL
jgi:hypothetical protein